VPKNALFLFKYLKNRQALPPQLGDLPPDPHWPPALEIRPRIPTVASTFDPKDRNGVEHKNN